VDTPDVLDREAIPAGEGDWGLEWDLAAIHAARGETATAMVRLERAYEAGFRFVRWAPVEPAFKDFRENHHCLSVMARMEGDIDRMRNPVFEAVPALRPQPLGRRPSPLHKRSSPCSFEMTLQKA
jgi:hypothetical protein